MPLTTQHAEVGVLDATTEALGGGLAWSAIRGARPARPTCRECRPGLHAKLSTKGSGRRLPTDSLLHRGRASSR
jgi:hypothetical protein